MGQYAKMKMEVRLGNLLHIKSRTGDRWSVNQKMLLNKLLRPGMGLLASEVEPLARFVLFGRSLARSHIRLRPLARTFRHARSLATRSPLYPRSLATPLPLACPLMPRASSHSVNTMPLKEVFFLALLSRPSFCVRAASPRSYPLPAACRPLTSRCPLAHSTQPARSRVIG